ncbi:MAG: ComEC/Rec2 family competence protein [Bryobacteraceae bacterium]
MFPAPLLPAAFTLISGVLLARLADFTILEAALAGAAFLGLALVCWRRHAPRLRIVCLLLATVCAGIWTASAQKAGPPPRLDAANGESVILSGCIVEPPALSAGREQFTLELAEGARARVSVSLDEGEAPPQLKYGQLVDADVKIREPHNFENPGGFDQVAWLARSKIFWRATARHAGAVRILPGSCGKPVRSWLFAIRTAAIERIDRLYPGDSPNASYDRAMMAAILIGDNSRLEKAWTEDFRRTSTYHALVISGLHISVLATVLLFLLRICLIPPIPSLALAAAAAWIYAAASGGSPPVIRAAAGFSLFLLAQIFFRRGRLLNFLALVAIGCVAIDPAEVYDASFQFSFLCVLALAGLAVPLLDATSTPLAGGMKRIGVRDLDMRLDPSVAQLRVEIRLAAETLSLIGLPSAFWESTLALLARIFFFVYETVVVSAIVQSALLLTTVLYFHRLSITGIAANVLVAPLLTWMVPVGFAAIFTGLPIFAGAASSMLGLSAAIASGFARLEPDWRIPDPPLWLAALFAVLIVTVVFLIPTVRLIRWFAIAGAGAAALLIAAAPFAPVTTPGQLELTAIDVAQGDSLLVVSPSGKTMLIDGGGFLTYGSGKPPTFDIGESVVSPYLWTRGFRRLDVIATTHSHADHAGGIAALLRNFRPREYWTGANPSPQLVALARQLGAKVVEWKAPAAMDFGGARLEVLAPAADYAPGEVPKNDDSLVLRVAFGTRALLLPGDAEKATEYQLAPGLSRSSVLKIGHHGSKTSSTDEFLDAVHPAIAVISAGFANQFRHPHPSVIERLESRHIEILRTDQMGLVTVRTDGRRLWAESVKWSTAGPAWWAWALD